MKSIAYILILFIGFSGLSAIGKVESLPTPQRQPMNVSSILGKLPLYFVKNQGQLTWRQSL